MDLPLKETTLDTEILTALLNGAILTGKHFSLRVAQFLLRLAAISEILKYFLP